MKRLILGAAIVLIGASLTPARAEGNANFNIGQRSMSDEFWDDNDLDPQDSFGANVDFGQDGSPIHVAFGLNTSGVFDWEDNDDSETAIAELSAGFLWVPDLKGRTQPFLGAGISRLAATVDLPIGSDESDTAFGFYANAGIYWRVTPRLNMGFDVRTVQSADLEFDASVVNLGGDDIEVDADHTQVGFLIGFNWGGR